MSEVKFSVWDKDNVVSTALYEIKNKDGSLNFRSWCTVLNDFLGPQGDFWNVENGEIKLNSQKTEADIKTKIASIYEEKADNMKQMAIRFQHSWDQFNRNDQVFNILDEFFGEELKVPVINARIWPSSLCPYQDDGFCVGEYTALDRSLLVAVHEIMHLYWWQVWNKNFDINDKSSWFLSEMAVETILRNSPLLECCNDQKIPTENMAHRQFYSMSIRGKNVFDELDKIYMKSDYNIVKFMDNAYKYVHGNFFEIKEKYYCPSKDEDSKDETKEKL